MTYKQLKESLYGKVILVGLTFIDDNHELIEQYQTYGTVTELTEDGLIRIKRNDNSIFQMPYNEDTLNKADKGQYRLRATQEIVIDPDFLITWEISESGNEDLEMIKSQGYIPPDE